MIGSTWSLQDPVVSGWTFMPGLKVLLYEILEHGNFLWSSLKGLGMPVLGNEVQEAPLYPLTLALLWVPEPYFWNSFVSLRWLLLGSGGFLLAYRVFGLERAGALAFVLTFSFAFWHLRFMNHPYLNGMAAGVWYWYFLLLLIGGGDARFSALRAIPALIGLTVSAYSVITCGFPEASVTVATITVILTGVFLFRRVVFKRQHLLADILVILTAHGLALALAAPQVFALIEFVGLTVPGHRVGLGLHQIQQSPIQLFLKQLMWDGTKSSHLTTTHIFGLTATTLFSVGFVRGLLIRTSWTGIAVLLCAVLFAAKNFPSISELIPAAGSLHRFIGTLPIAEQMWWTGYAYPLVLIFFAYFAGRGFDQILGYGITHREHNKRQRVMLPFVSVVTVLVAAGFFATHAMKTSPLAAIVHSPGIQQTIALFLIFALLVVIGPHFFRTGTRQIMFAALLLFAITLEQRIYIDHNRVEIEEVQALTHLAGQGSQIEAILADHGFNRHDYRFTDVGARGHRFGLLTLAGFASFKNGAAAIYTHRQQLFRKHVLGADWDGYFIEPGMPPNRSWQRSAAGLFLASTYNFGQGRGSIDQIPINLYEAGLVEEFIGEIMQIARKHGALPSLLEEYRKDLRNALETSNSSDAALRHTMHYINGVIPQGSVYNDRLSFAGSLDHFSNQEFRMSVSPEAFRQDRVSCSRLGLKPDGVSDQVFIINLKAPLGEELWTISQLELIRKHPVSINHTSSKHHILGVSENPDASLSNDADGTVDIPLGPSGIKLFLFACADGNGRANSQYQIRVVLQNMAPEAREARFQKLGMIGLPLHLLESRGSSAYIEAVTDLAAKSGGKPGLIGQHTPELLAVVGSSETTQEAFYHSMRFLKRVGSHDLHEFIPRELYLDREALPRAYMPERCGSASDMDDSLRQILDHRFNIRDVVIENPSVTTQNICQQQQETFRRVRIESDYGKQIMLEEIQGPGIVVLNDYFYPGWHATDEVSGESIEIHPANLAFRALTLPEARPYRVTLTYRPDWLNMARISVISALLALTGLLMYQAFRIRRDWKLFKASNQVDQ